MQRRGDEAKPERKSDRTFDAVSAAEHLVPVIRAARAEAEQIRHVPRAVAEELAVAGLLQMFLARGLGGPQLPPLEVFRAIETISRADGSIGWCAMIASILSARLSWLEPEIARGMVGTPADARLAGSIRAQGRARPVEGGFRIEGQWDFASGMHHARWLMCPCVIVEDGKPVLNSLGQPSIRAFWVPSSSVKLVDTWHVMGLRGTGSHDFVVDDVLVPASRSALFTEPPRHDGVLYDTRLNLAWSWTATVAHALGIARSAIDDFIALAGAKSTTMSTALLRDRAPVQAKIGEAEAIVSAARAYVFDAVGTLWRDAGLGRTDLDHQVLQARLAITHGMREAARAVDLVFHAAGTNAVYERNRLECQFRDIHVALQHGAALPSHIEAAGKVVLGLRPSDPGW